jgi:hypothetical protein
LAATRSRVIRKTSCTAVANSCPSSFRRRFSNCCRIELARVTAHADDEGKAELLLVGVVQAMEAGELLLRQRVEADARLLVPRLFRHGAGARGLAGEIGMLAEERDLRRVRCCVHRRHHPEVKVGDSGKRPLRVRRLGDPRRELERIADRGGERPASVHFD